MEMGGVRAVYGVFATERPLGSICEGKEIYIPKSGFPSRHGMI